MMAMLRPKTYSKQTVEGQMIACCPFAIFRLNAARNRENKVAVVLSISLLVVYELQPIERS